MRARRSADRARPELVVSGAQVASFRWRRHRLNERAPRSEAESVLGAICGAQSQLLSASEIALSARVDGIRRTEVETALWSSRRLARAWCMRRTVFLLPARELGLFVAGSARRADREILWARRHGVAEEALETGIAHLFAALDRPRTGEELATEVGRRLGCSIDRRTGGGWGSGRAIPWVRVGRRRLPITYLLHLAGARGALCFGPARGAESTYVRADGWISPWDASDRATAEPELLRRYLSAYGPATERDYARWTGMRLRDVREIWRAVGAELVPVAADGERAWLRSADVESLQRPVPDTTSVRLLPYFDSFLLGHDRHHHLAPTAHLPRIYRPQGWVSPTVVVDGRVRGLWEHRVEAGALRLTVRPFDQWSRPLRDGVDAEADRLARFLEVDLREVRVDRRPTGRA